MKLIVTAGTILRWHRDIIRRRWSRRSRQGRSGRPATHRKVRSVARRLARDNESWRYRRIHGELAELGITVAPSPVGPILRERRHRSRAPPGGTRLGRVPAIPGAGILALDLFTAAGARIIRAAVQAPRMNSIMERWAGSCRRELLDRTLVWNQRHLMIVLREYEDFCNTHRPHRALKQAAPLRQLPDGITDLDQFRVQRRDRAGGVIHEYRLVA